MEVGRERARRGPTVNRSKGSFPVAIVEYSWLALSYFAASWLPPGALTPETRV